MKKKKLSMREQGKQDQHWYAVYTRSRAEKKLYQLLTQKEIDCFLPLKKTLVQRSDRKKWVEQPLLSSYLFVKIEEKDRFEVLNTAGAVKYVSFGGQPVRIPSRQIEHLAHLVRNRAEDVVAFEGQLEKGDLVEVNEGTLKGVIGEVIEIRGKQRLLLRFESLGYCVHAEISMHEIKPNEENTN